MRVKWIRRKNSQKRGRKQEQTCYAYEMEERISIMKECSGEEFIYFRNTSTFPRRDLSFHRRFGESAWETVLIEHVFIKIMILGTLIKSKHSNLRKKPALRGLVVQPDLKVVPFGINQVKTPCSPPRSATTNGFFQRNTRILQSVVRVLENRYGERRNSYDWRRWAPPDGPLERSPRWWLQIFGSLGWHLTCFEVFRTFRNLSCARASL